MKPCQESGLTSQNLDERRIKCCRSLLNAADVGSESLSAFSEYLVETILAFVEALGHNVVMLHSDQELVLVQLLKAMQRRRGESSERW